MEIAKSIPEFGIASINRFNKYEKSFKKKLIVTKLGNSMKKLQMWWKTENKKHSADKVNEFIPNNVKDVKYDLWKRRKFIVRNFVIQATKNKHKILVV